MKSVFEQNNEIQAYSEMGADKDNKTNYDRVSIAIDN